MLRFAGCVAVGLVCAPVALAGTTSGIDYVERDVEFNGAFQCSIDLTIDRESVANVGAPLVAGPGFYDGGLGGVDVVSLDGLDPLNTSGAALNWGGNQYNAGGDIRAVAELIAVFATNCTNGVQFRMLRDVTMGVNTGATVHYANGIHAGSGWEIGTYATLNPGVLSGPAGSIADGSTYQFDLTWNFPAGEQATGNTYTTITMSAYAAP